MKMTRAAARPLLHPKSIIPSSCPHGNRGVPFRSGAASGRRRSRVWPGSFCGAASPFHRAAAATDVHQEAQSSQSRRPKQPRSAPSGQPPDLQPRARPTLQGAGCCRRCDHGLKEGSPRAEDGPGLQCCHSWVTILQDSDKTTYLPPASLRTYACFVRPQEPQHPFRRMAFLGFPF